jgi:hypothetical protein
MIDFVHERAIQWSLQIRNRDYNGLYIPISDLLTYDYSHNPEGLTQEAQELSSAVFRMRTTPAVSDPHNVLIAYYLFAGKDKMKAAMMGVSMAKYWRYLLNGQHYVAARIPHPLQEIA